MFEIEFKSKKFRKYVLRILGKKDQDIIEDTEINQIKSLKISKSLINDFNIIDLVFFSNLETLTLDGINIDDSNIGIISGLKDIKKLVISNSVIDLEDKKYLSDNIKSIVFVNCKNVNVKSINENKNLTSLSIISSENIQIDGISELENLEEVILPNNKKLEDEDIQDLWNSKKLRMVNFDGDSNISCYEHEGVKVSHEEQFTPTENKAWKSKNINFTTYDLSYLINLSDDRIDELENIDINIEAKDLELLKSQKVKSLINRLKNNNRINLSLNNTAEMDIETMEKLNEMCGFSKVYVKTGWKGTQNKGYSYDTYNEIKKEILKIVNSIDSNLSEQEKYIEIRKRIAENINYDYAAISASENEVDYYASRNLENGLLNHTCVCAGYADIMKNVLAEVGIDCIYVEGETDKEEAHAWNQVKLRGDDGEYHWYNDDITWDAINGGYTNCALTDEVFARTHKAMPERTDGKRPYECNAVPPSAVRIAKGSNKENIRVDEIER